MIHRLIPATQLPVMHKFLLLATIVIGHGAFAMGEDREWIPVNKLLAVTYLDKFYETPLADRDKIRMRGAMKPSNASIKASDVVLTIVHADRKERIHVAADGSFDLTPTEKLVKDNPMVLTNMPPGEKAAVAFAVYAVIPADLKFGYASFMAGIQQANDLVKSKAGLLRVFAPKFSGLELHFAKPAQQTLQILGKNGARTLVADAKGIIAVKLDSTTLADNPQIALSECPIEVELTAE